jgi:hypothetical protein
MPIAGPDSFLHGLHGKFGKQAVVRDVNGQSVVSNVPNYVDKKTLDELKYRDRFSLVSKLAKVALEDPVERARYESLRKIGQYAYHVAYAEIYQKHFPGTNPNGKKKRHRKGKILTQIINGLPVKDITLIIDTADATITKSGVIVPDKHVLDWIYAAALQNTTQKFSTIMVRIRFDSDHPDLTTT